MKLFFVVCNNGLGHFKRCIEILFKLTKKIKHYEANIACEKWQVNRFSDNYMIKELISKNNIRWHFDIISPGIKIEKDPLLYHDGRLINWIERLDGIRSFEKSDIVLSDNLVQVLSLRKDAILQGSFFWSDVFEYLYPKDNYVKDFINSERLLLDSNKPNMICNKFLAMDSIFKKTKPVLTEWSGHDPKKRKNNNLNKRKKIAILIGATTLAESIARKLIMILSETSYDIAVPKNINSKIQNNNNISSFNFGSEDFLSCDLAICRPGLGTIQDCIYYSLPMIMFYENDNIELKNNALKISELGMGIILNDMLDIGKDNPNKLLNIIRNFIESDQFTLIKEIMIDANFNGSDQTINWIINHQSTKVLN